MTKALIGVLALCCAATSRAQPPTWSVLETLYDARWPAPIAAGDFDGDGDVDLVDREGSVALNDGHAHFTRAAGSGGLLAERGYRSTPRDLDGDGDLDLLTVVASGVELWRGNGSGVFAADPSATPALPTSPSAVAMGDLDGDGDVDALVGGAAYNWTGAGLRTWLNDGGGTFVEQTVPLPGQPSIARVVIGDLDGDADLDAIAVHGTTDATLLWNAGNGTFTAAPLAPASGAPLRDAALADVDGDGDLDVAFLWIAGTRLDVILNQNAVFTSVTTLSTPFLGPSRLLALDVDGDTDAELLVPIAQRAPALFDFVAGTITGPVEVVAAGMDVVLGDLDGDGDTDAVVSDEPVQYQQTARHDILLNDGASLAPADGTLSGPARAARVPALGDVDGDGDLDVLGYETGRVIVHLNDGRGRLTWDPAVGVLTTASPPTASTQTFVHAFDADADGDADLVHVDGNGPTTVLVNGPAGWFAVMLPASPVIPKAIATGDLNADGLEDIVMGDVSNWNQSLVFINNGGYAFTATPFGGQRQTEDLVLADVDGDVDLDVVEANANFTPLQTPSAIWLNDGTGNFLTPGPTSPVNHATEVTSADFDQDGIIDCVWDLGYYRGLGGGAFLPPAAIPGLPIGNPFFTADLKAVDVDRDGWVDLVDGIGRWWPNLAGAAIGTERTFDVRCLYPMPVGDLDQDGDPDLLGEGPVVLLNRTVQLAVREPVRPGRPASLELYGEPGAPWTLYASTGPGFGILPMGVLLIDPLLAVPVTSGTFDPITGASAFTTTVPPASVSLGATLHWQALVFESTGVRLSGARVTTVRAF